MHAPLALSHLLCSLDKHDPTNNIRKIKPTDNADTQHDHTNEHTQDRHDKQDLDREYRPDRLDEE